MTTAADSPKLVAGKPSSVLLAPNSAAVIAHSGAHDLIEIGFARRFEQTPLPKHFLCQLYVG